MNGRKSFSVISAALALALLIPMLGGCGIQKAPGETAAPVSAEGAAGTAAPAETPEAVSGAEAAAASESGRRDGERFDAVILLEGMEETVRYEHVRNDALGFEMDFEYENLARRSDADRECFVSLRDLPGSPMNALEVTYRAENAETVAAAVREELSQKYELLEGTRELARAGSCLRIEASGRKGTGTMADLLQVVTILPASEGCLVVTEHFSAEAAEGFGRRFSYMLNTLAVIDRRVDSLSDEDALTAVRNYCTLSNPDLAEIVNAGEYPVYWELSSSTDAQAVVLFRSYTGAQIRYYMDRVTGNTRVTEFVPGVSSGETQTDESFNARNYLLSIPGTWQTASMANEADGTVQPAYHVLFTPSDILYGHIKDGAFVFNHADPVMSFERTPAGGFMVRALSSNGVQYSFRTSESDADVLEYYETWEEAAFPDRYRGGASLVKGN